MMTSNTTHLPATRHAALKLMALLALVCASFTPAFAQTGGGTIISNQASAAYSDGTNSYSTVSNTVTVTVANVSGLRITPDAASNPAVVPGQPNVDYVFTVTNIGNFADQVRFLQSGQSMTVSGPGTITAAVVDNGDNVIGAGDTDILTNTGGDVLHALAQNASAVVIVRLTISAAATAGQTVQVFLGDAGSSVAGDGNDNQPANSSANEVRTVSATSVNGLREARGDLSSSVQDDVQLRAVLTVPAGPVALGSNITYGLQACNDGNRAAVATNLGAFSGVFVVAPIPVGTTLSATNAFPAGTLYTTSALTTAPQSATWSTTAPAPLSSTTRVAINIGATLGSGGTCSTSFPMILTITTANASTPIYGIIDAFAKNTVSAEVTDQSGDNLNSKGDGNANFNEPIAGGAVSATQGFQLPTLLQMLGAVLIGPSGQPAAVGPTNSNDDYTNRSINTGIAGVVPGGSTTAPGTVIFTNTVQNTGNANDTYTLTAPTVPSGFTVEISTNGGGSYTTVSGGGSVGLAVAYGASVNILVRVTAPTGRTVLASYNTVIHAVSTVTPASSNETIDRLYTGFLRLDKTVSVTNGTGVGGPTAAVPGAVIEYVITYTNIASTGGTGNSTLTANNIVITENGSAGTNNWGTTTNQVVGSASDTAGGVITGDSGGSTILTDTIASLGAGQSGVFRFKRTIQ